MREMRRGFTLIEIMIVVVLISLLMGLVSVNLVGRLESAKRRVARVAVKSTLAQPIQQFYLDNNRYPTTEEGLEALIENPAAGELTEYDEEGYADEDQLLDPWGKPYQYACPGSHGRSKFDLWSMGPDRQPGTSDDIVNWGSR